MVKKRLEDLLREEAQKSPNSEADSEQTIELEVKATVVPETDPETTEDESSATAAKRTNSTKAELETTIKELKAALQASEAENKSLQRQISTLQSDLQQQKILADLAEKLQAELDEAKQLILKLSEANSKPLQSVSQSSSKQQSSERQNLALSRLPKAPQSPTFDSPVVINQGPDVGWFD